MNDSIVDLPVSNPIVEITNEMKHALYYKTLKDILDRSSPVLQHINALSSPTDFASGGAINFSCGKFTDTILDGKNSSLSITISQKGLITTDLSWINFNTWIKEAGALIDHVVIKAGNFQFSVNNFAQIFHLLCLQTPDIVADGRDFTKTWSEITTNGLGQFEGTRYINEGTIVNEGNEITLNIPFNYLHDIFNNSDVFSHISDLSIQVYLNKNFRMNVSNNTYSDYSFGTGKSSVAYKDATASYALNGTGWSISDVHINLRSTPLITQGNENEIFNTYFPTEISLKTFESDQQVHDMSVAGSNSWNSVSNDLRKIYVFFQPYDKSYASNTTNYTGLIMGSEQYSNPGVLESNLSTAIIDDLDRIASTQALQSTEAQHYKYQFKLNNKTFPNDDYVWRNSEIHSMTMDACDNVVSSDMCRDRFFGGSLKYNPMFRDLTSDAVTRTWALTGSGGALPAKVVEYLTNIVDGSQAVSFMIGLNLVANRELMSENGIMSPKKQLQLLWKPPTENFAKDKAHNFIITTISESKSKFRIIGEKLQQE